MQKTKIIEEEINRVLDEIESAKNFINMEEKLKQNLENFIQYLNDFMGLNPFNLSAKKSPSEREGMNWHKTD